jgi:hypothetical protein
MAGVMAPREAQAQLGALVSPGGLSRAHAPLEGITNCLTCHAPGQGVSARKCLACHQPVADRIARKKGVHRSVTTDCVSCHVEHAGADGELRPFDPRKFDHGAQAGFPLDGLHAPLAASCDSCHKTRSFLTIGASCASCHTDAHRGALGDRCAACHTTSIKFAESRLKFDHTRTAFPLSGAHGRVTCASCHADTKTYKVRQFSSCASCHADPHQPRSTSACASCHTPETWRTTKVDHSRTAFPLKGKHAVVQCAKCHVQPATTVKPRSETCATCHADPHRGSFKQDCRACHNESGWQKGAFDHAGTRFPLVDKHAALQCIACHKGPATPGAVTARARPVQGRPAQATDFRGLRTECVSCHADVHGGELGTTCESCHTARAFSVTAFTHARPRAFFGGQHSALSCVQCHKGPVAAAPVRSGATPAASALRVASAARMPHVGLTRTPDTCVSCHRDAHMGQVSTRCES